jgi:succinate-acetate transporter protein
MKSGNPAVVGLAGFGLTTLLLQVHNLGLMGWGPILAMGLIFGGLAQMIAGFQEQKLGNNFGYTAFVSYGAFWIGLSLIQTFNHLGFHPTSPRDLGFYLVAWTLYTVILFIASFRIHTAMTFTFGTLVIGFILLDLAHFGFPGLKFFAAIDLIVCALGAWYMMAGILLNDLAGKTVLPMGRKLLN